MSTYARVVDGVAVELVTPSGTLTPADMFVPALASTFVEIPSGTTIEPGWTLTGSVWAAPTLPPVTLAQEAAAAIAAGVSIVSTGTPSIDRVYAMDAGSRATLAGVVAGINAGDGLPGGGSSFTYIDTLGTIVLPGTAVTLGIAKAIRDTLYNLELIAAGAPGAPTSLPAQPVTIA